MNQDLIEHLIKENSYKGELPNGKPIYELGEADVSLIAKTIMKKFDVTHSSLQLTCKNKMDLGEWMRFNKITENGCGGYKWDGVNFSAFNIEKMYNAYKM